MRTRNYNAAASSLDNINSVLPEQYMVTIDDRLYEESKIGGIYYTCTGCTETVQEIGADEKPREIKRPREIPLKDLKPFTIKNTSFEKYVTGKDEIEHWQCPHCNKIHKTHETDVVTPRVREPFYYKVVPSCPVKKAGLITRFGYDQRFESWYYNYLRELEHQIGRYRAEYENQRDSDVDDEDEGYRDEGLD